ncbi:hypothetical protein M422DRAFT_251136 [Sphaerobolus stellatus SS14]|uniref:Uncharacterized protein n=1 Tax=Sphaerobolus stellatus (strain SS14) TaxID=990650 RepID=A0A0C9UR40_SPHS4|nr:hypothetical protein M422DRAFT_251136 [Sphaerobolus stellatus SS14]
MQTFMLLVFQPIINSVNTALEACISSIILCRFVLDLRKFNERTQTVPSFSIRSFSGVRAHLQHFNESLLEELGSSCLNERLEDCFRENENGTDTTPRDGIVTEELAITVEEFPWALTTQNNVLP